ncbi:VQ motif-containing protein [Striga asiatica]|uniref:VQ motif-containing protein n=1 Tax=Striga asiatica TaxID=4170 RepID=A0A5A7R2F9_STRAF|nr:VQ motif-containing protein [Striga asiatica]
MASSDNLMTMEQPWGFRPTFTDAWISDIYARESDTLTKALQMSFAADSSGDGGSAAFFPVDMVDSLLLAPDAAPSQTPSASGCSESEVAAAAAAAARPRRNLPPASGGVAKRRKSRASKRSTTTFITADAANFRQMVQQVTGVRIPGGVPPPLTAAAAQMMRPEPHRVVDRLQMGGLLPTFDTSAFLLDSSAGGLAVQPPPAVTDGGGIDFDPFCSFPTLESWKVM